MECPPQPKFEVCIFILLLLLQIILYTSSFVALYDFKSHFIMVYYNYCFSDYCRIFNRSPSLSTRFNCVHNLLQSLDQDGKNKMKTYIHVLYHTKLRNTLISDHEPICVQTHSRHYIDLFVESKLNRRTANQRLSFLRS